MNKQTALLREHVSEGDGWPHDPWGDRYFVTKNAGAGRARCTCGALSEELDSSRQRRAWQKQHRLDVLEQFLYAQQALQG